MLAQAATELKPIIFREEIDWYGVIFQFVSFIGTGTFVVMFLVSVTLNVLLLRHHTCHYTTPLDYNIRFFGRGAIIFGSAMTGIHLLYRFPFASRIPENLKPYPEVTQGFIRTNLHFIEGLIIPAVIIFLLSLPLHAYFQRLHARRAQPPGSP